MIVWGLRQDYDIPSTCYRLNVPRAIVGDGINKCSGKGVTSNDSIVAGVSSNTRAICRMVVRSHDPSSTS